MKRVCFVALCLTRGLFGWGCDGHQLVARIAEKNLTANAATNVTRLLSENPIDSSLMRYCVQGREDLMADASTWADDVRRTAGTGKWHYMDIPRQVTSGNIEKWCEPVGPPNPKGERDGCVISAIAYNLQALKNDAAPAPERAIALRYLIHLVGDLHQPLHTTDNHDQGGNCAPLAVLDQVSISNLHSAWDSGLLEERLQSSHETAVQLAGELARRFAPTRNTWSGGDAQSWAWESHAAGIRTTYGGLRPPIPEEPVSGKTDCSAESQKVYALHIHLDREYAGAADPVIDEQLAKAGFRLAKILNEIWP